MFFYKEIRKEEQSMIFPSFKPQNRRAEKGKRKEGHKNSWSISTHNPSSPLFLGASIKEDSDLSC
jgi:hypothetical protein